MVYDLRARGVGKQFKAANQLGAARVVVVGPEEVQRGVVTVREMSTGDEEEISIESLLRKEEPTE